MAVTVRLSLRIRLFAGREWPPLLAHVDTTTSSSRTTAPVPTPSQGDTRASKSAMKGSSHTIGKKTVLFKDDNNAGSGHRKKYRENIKQHLPPQHPVLVPAGGKRSVRGQKQLGSGDELHVGRDTADATEISLKGIVVQCRLYPAQAADVRARVRHESSIQVIAMFLYFAVAYF